MIYGSYDMGDVTELSYTNKIQLVRATTSSMRIVFAISNEQGHTKDGIISGIILLDPLLKFIYPGGPPDSRPAKLGTSPGLMLVWVLGKTCVNQVSCKPS